jgi:hypothetical protein
MSLGFTLISALISRWSSREAKTAGASSAFPTRWRRRRILVEQGDRRVEHLRDMLVGNIVSVQWPEVWTTAALPGDRIFTTCSDAGSWDLDGPQIGDGARRIRHFWDFCSTRRLVSP